MISFRKSAATDPGAGRVLGSRESSSDVADLSPQHQHDCPGQHLRRRLLRRRPARPLRRGQPLAVDDPGARRARAAGAVQPRAPRRRHRHRLPLLPHLGRGRPSFAGIPPTKTCMNCHSQIWANSPLLEPVRESFRTGRADPVDARPRPARLRLLRPQHPREQGRRLHDLPRPGRPDAADVAGAVAADGVVPRLPPRARALRPAARRRVQRRLRAARRTSSSSARGWSPSISIQKLTSCSTCHR